MLWIRNKNIRFYEIVNRSLQNGGQSNRISHFDSFHGLFRINGYFEFSKRSVPTMLTISFNLANFELPENYEIPCFVTFFSQNPNKNFRPGGEILDPPGYRKQTIFFFWPYHFCPYLV